MIFQLKQGKCSFSELYHGIVDISQKMLLEQLDELRRYGLVDKKAYPGFPLKVEYFLTARGEKMLSAVLIMQEVGIDYMVEHGMTSFLDKKGIPYDACILTKK